jgi:hypothetical protein
MRNEEGAKIEAEESEPEGHGTCGVERPEEQPTPICC